MMTRFGKKFCAAVTAAAITMSQMGLCVSSYADSGEFSASEENEKVYTGYAAAAEDEDLTGDENTTDEESTTEEEDHIKGDIDNNGKVDITDVTLAISHVRGKKRLNGKAKEAADINNDTRVDITDVTMIIRIVRGLNNKPAVPEEPKDPEITVKPEEPKEPMNPDLIEDKDVSYVPKNYTALEKVITEKKALHYEFEPVEGAEGYVITFFNNNNGQEITVADGVKTPVADITTAQIGTARSIEIRVKPFNLVDTRTRPNVRNYLDGYKKAVIFKPGNISSKLTVKSVPKSVTLSWSAATGATGYEVYYTISGQSEKLYTTTSDTSVTMTVQTEKKYSFRVLPINKSYAYGEAVIAKATKSVSESVTTLPYYELAAKKLDQVGWDLKSAYNWCASMKYNSSGLSNTGSSGTAYYAEYGFKHGYGNCYVMAACFYQMAKMLGYDAHQIQSYTYRTGGYWGNHSWVEIDNFTKDGVTKTYIFDPDFTVETGKNGYAISYGDKGTWMYDYYGTYYKKRMN